MTQTIVNDSPGVVGQVYVDSYGDRVVAFDEGNTVEGPQPIKYVGWLQTGENERSKVRWTRISHSANAWKKL